MATKTTPTPAKPSKANSKTSASREVANWDEELAKDAAEAAKTEASTSTGSMFSLKAGILAFNDTPLAGNQMVCVIADGILENVSYDAGYDEDNPTPPRCFAFGRDDKIMKPHEDVFARKQQVHEQCTGCPRNAFGSAPPRDGKPSRGKACGNRRRLALISAGSIHHKTDEVTLVDDPDQLSAETFGFMKLPVSSITGYAAYVKQLEATMKRPPHGVFTKIAVIPDRKSQFKVTFECLGKIPNELMAVAMAKHKEAMAVIEQPYNLDAEQPVAGPASRKAAGKTAAKKTARKF